MFREGQVLASDDGVVGSRVVGVERSPWKLRPTVPMPTPTSYVSPDTDPAVPAQQHLQSGPVPVPPPGLPNHEPARQPTLSMPDLQSAPVPTQLLHLPQHELDHQPQDAPEPQFEWPAAVGPEVATLPHLMYPASSTVKRSGLSNKGTTSRYRDYDVSRLGTCEYRYDSSVQGEHSMPGIQPLYTPYHALVSLINQYAQGIGHQPTTPCLHSSCTPVHKLTTQPTPSKCCSCATVSK